MELEDIGKKIKQYRKDKKISQEALCKNLRISRATLSTLENAKGDVGVRKLLQIADFVGLEVTLRDRSPFPTLEELRDE